jgi:dipeptidyl-peptidase 4
MLAMLGMDTPTTCWSPDGNRIAAYRVDLTGVSKSPQVHYLKRDDEVVHRHHAKAGGVLERYELFLLDVYGRPPVPIDLGDTTDTYPVFAGWLPDASAVLVLQFDRLLTRVDAYLADATTGDTIHLFSEEADTFIRIHHDIYYGRKVGLDLTPDGRHLIWESTRDGWTHLYLYSVETGELVRQLTSGAWPVDRVRQVTADGTVVFTARIDQQRPYDLHVCSVPLAGGEVRQLTTEPGVHTFIPAPSGTAFIDTCSTPDQPPVTVLRGMDGRVRAELVRADISTLQETVGWTAPEQFTVKAADGDTDLWGVMYKPSDFDPARTYPVIEYVYGGPQIAVATHSFASHEAGFAKQAQALAQLGYITVVLDARGTPGRSKAFHDVVHRSPGPLTWPTTTPRPSASWPDATTSSMATASA